uniref:Phosphatidic acid phosphatase type 2/haloperoxidase domain-containing protein n=1 Tax=Chromera velia CCMP2878 TaxID=1169474 RepID=A0A0G4GZF0_9ALVE|eukprot:Cvel_24026.t1-p1 / transcript=Cvel_24026.t1 / gene=Cvel_24026 / organism=Chromera_velia_CCMP2878 / gene_product=hypothetical protein / transcript_product=hypothetical protein / location=Cvel_scaffold2550:3260-9838(+) / protein_length=628 / sequence_SO=supercontig / SO=protein_coding / is_pseudo=false
MSEPKGKKEKPGDFPLLEDQGVPVWMSQCEAKTNRNVHLMGKDADQIAKYEASEHWLAGRENPACTKALDELAIKKASGDASLKTHRQFFWVKYRDAILKVIKKCLECVDAARKTAVSQAWMQQAVIPQKFESFQESSTETQPRGPEDGGGLGKLLSLLPRATAASDPLQVIKSPFDLASILALGFSREDVARSESLQVLAGRGGTSAASASQSTESIQPSETESAEAVNTDNSAQFDVEAGQQEEADNSCKPKGIEDRLRRLDAIAAGPRLLFPTTQLSFSSKVQPFRSVSVRYEILNCTSKGEASMSVFFLHWLTHVAFKRNTGFAVFPILFASVGPEIVFPFILLNLLCGATAGLLKHTLQVPRPYWVRHSLQTSGLESEGYATPSQHAVASAVPVAVFALFAPSAESVAVLVLLATSVGRIVLGNHYVQDVLAGLAVVLFWGLILVACKDFIPVVPVNMETVWIIFAVLTALAACLPLTFFLFPEIPFELRKLWRPNAKDSDPSPRNTRKFWWSIGGGAGLFLGSGIVYAAPWWTYRNVLPEESFRFRSRGKVTVAFSVLYSFMLYCLIEKGRGLLRRLVGKGVLSQVFEGGYYLVFSAGSLLFFAWLADGGAEGRLHSPSECL